ncbi:MAG: FHA domain-containing protein [Thermoguttaceae bacterium]
MSQVTLRIVDGPERGRVYNRLPLPLTIGREEGNSVQLNDERISRYHLKIHEDAESVLLTDLQSTNGTRVNGETVQLWILRPGDLITIGRSVLLFGTPTEIGQRLAKIRRSNPTSAVSMGVPTDYAFLDEEERRSSEFPDSIPGIEAELFRGLTLEEVEKFHLLFPPELPSDLPPKQTTQLAEFLQYIHLRLRYLIATIEQEPVVCTETDPAKITLDSGQWENLLDLYSRLSMYLHSITEPQG